MAFGESAQIYNSARKDYLDEIINNIVQYILENRTYNITLLDLGCGTGIATRQLAKALKQATIFGCDIDPDMIKEAQKISNDISYYIMSTNKLNIDSLSITAITAFGSFHWFCDTESVKEIKRVLQYGGALFIVNKDNDKFKQEIYPIIHKYCPPDTIYSKEYYKPKLILQKNGFVEIREHKYESEEIYNNIDELIDFIKSLNFWNYILQNNKNDLLIELKKSLEDKFKNGISYIRKVDITLIWGKKI
ncbi:MAG: SAM-dependent methyltransferase [Burkholderiales bacterium]|jgi:ubiquinone/menaquinone biosynthesis C-methylase UbiE|nr:SAM-dependent methyltransferase [Burkholderiales bacterium]